MRQIYRKIFKLVFFSNMFGIMLLCLPFIWLNPYEVACFASKLWCNSSLFLLRLFFSIRYAVRGEDTIPPAPFLCLSKHQSIIETFFLFKQFPNACFVIKKELMDVPLFHIYLKAGRHIAIDRETTVKSLTLMKAAAAREIDAKRPIILFPEGTRTKPLAPPDYKMGFLLLHRQTNVPIVLLALNTGLFWPPKDPLFPKGTMVFEFLPCHDPQGLNKQNVEARVIAPIEQASARLAGENLA